MKKVYLSYFIKFIMEFIMQFTTFSFKDLVIFDSEVIIHIFNNLLRFSNFQKTFHDDYLLTKTSKIPILRYEDISM